MRKATHPFRILDFGFWILDFRPPTRRVCHPERGHASAESEDPIHLSSRGRPFDGRVEGSPEIGDRPICRHSPTGEDPSTRTPGALGRDDRDRDGLASNDTRLKFSACTRDACTTRGCNCGAAVSAAQRSARMSLRALSAPPRGPGKLEMTALTSPTYEPGRRGSVSRRRARHSLIRRRALPPRLRLPSGHPRGSCQYCALRACRRPWRG